MTKYYDEFNVERHFDNSLAEKYDRRIRMFCPSYDALHRMILPLFQGLPNDAFFLLELGQVLKYYRWERFFHLGDS
ncbi:hypothetical protein [Desulfolutivibrio sulfoxidireducens]|uniref:hypothetical protein n=1 Tax=Desulfolutivibrio sulfoxidireducens TaxID=2773299 RepID=UPI001C40117C|nr:hypothetical protein [Desulfolutivibrio sulfoxidireducens]